MKKSLVLFIAIILGIVISGCVSSKSPVTAAFYETINQNIVDGVIPVPAGKYVFYQFSVPSDATLGGTVSGDFTAFGGSGNDINVIIVDETDYINLINGHDVSANYESGQMTTGRINESLPAGKYYLVYSNTFSTLSDKNVKTKVDVSYSICTKNCR